MSLPITPVQMISLPAVAPADATSAAGGTGAFQSMLEGMIAPVEQSQAQANQAVQNFLSGGDEELHSVALAAQRADLRDLCVPAALGQQFSVPFHWITDRMHDSTARLP